MSSKNVQPTNLLEDKYFKCILKCSNYHDDKEYQKTCIEYCGKIYEEYFHKVYIPNKKSIF